MISPWRQRFAALDPKARWALVTALLLFALLEIWLLGLRGPLQQWRKAQAERESQAQMMSPDLSADIAEARKTLAATHAQAEALKSAHQPERLDAWRSQLQSVVDKHQVILQALSASQAPEGLPRISLTLKGRYADVLAVQHSLPGLEMPLQATRWSANVLPDGTLGLQIEAIPRPGPPGSMPMMPAAGHDPFGSVRTPTQTTEVEEERLPALRALVAAGPRSMVVMGEQVVEIGGLVQGYRLIAVHEDRALFVKQGRHVTAVLDTPAAP